MLSTKTRRRVLRASGAGFLGLILLILTAGATAAAPSGSGTMSVIPGTAAAGQAGQTLVFTFRSTDANAYLTGSILRLDIPSGWTAPQSSNSLGAGYVSVANASGTSCNPQIQSISGQQITVQMACANNTSFTITYSNVTPQATAGSPAFLTWTRNGTSESLVQLTTSPTVTVTVSDNSFTVTLWVRTCSDYAHVPSNWERDVSYGGSWGGNDNGHHNLDLGTFYGTPSTAPNVDVDGGTTGYTVSSTDANLCEASSGIIGIYAGQDARHNGSGATLQRATSVGTSGTVIQLTAAEVTLANAGSYTGGLFFSETNQADFSPEYTLNQYAGFADIRCWRDLHYSDNSEEIYNKGSATSAVCVVYNVKPKLTWTSTVPTNAYVGGPTYTAAATSTGNSSTEDFSPTVYSSETPSVCTVNSSTGVVTFVGAGTCTIDTNQAMQADSSDTSPFWAAAAQIQQSFTVKAAPTIATTLSATSVAIGASVHDSASLTGATPSAGGTVTYTVYSNSTCTSGAQSAGTVTVTNGSIPNSSDLSFANAGTYYWQAVYSGDANNNVATSPCLSEILTVNRNTLTITALGQSKTYGTAYTLQTGPTTYSVTGVLLPGDSITGVTLTATGTPSGLGASDPAGGTYPIHPSSATGSFNPANYTITYVDGLLTVNKAPSVVTVTCPSSVVYNGSAQTPCSATVTGAGGLDESVPVVYLDDHTNIGTAHVSATYAGDANHTGSSGTGSFDIVAATVTCTVTPYHVTYDGSSHTATGTCRGPNGEDLSSGLVLSGTTHTAAGTYTDGWSFSYPGYAPQSGTITDQIDRAPLTITANNQTKTYGQTVTFAGTEFTSVGLQNGETIGSVTLTSAGAAAGAGVAGSPYPITPSAATGSFDPNNYTISYVDGLLTVNKAPSVVTVTCPSSVVYNGSAQTPCSATVTGAGGLDESVPVVYLDDHTNIGTAHVSATYAGDANHTGSSDTGSFDITALGVTCNVTGYHVTYDGSSHTATGTCRGPTGEDLSSGLVLTGTIHTDAGVTSDGWSFSYPGYAPQSGTITDQIDRAPLTITANNQTKTYGQTVTFAGTEFTPSGLRNGETVGSATITSTGAGSGAAVGPYAITISDATGGTFNPTNYTVSYVPGTLTVTARPVLVVTPNDQTRVRGAANPVFTYTITGFVDGDDKSDLSPAPTCTTIADASSPVGTYPITCSGGDTSKYDYDYRPGTLTVTAKPVLHVTANNLSKNEGDPNPSLTYTITGFIDGDDESDLTSPVTCTTTATDSSPAGTYPITCSGAASNKYAMTYTAGVLTVVGSRVGGETEAPVRSPTPPVTSAAGDVPLENSMPLIGFLICLAFGALGLLAVQAQRRRKRLR